ncbi:hypothetical protein [Pelagibacterium mangrovi]|uniref:hypothetical protein n=1 Tax=Pelagibacterium mangrovi TaxID=3119828 RepID=UPI002FCC110B
MRTTTIRTALHPADSDPAAPRPDSGFIGAVQSVLIVAGCVAMGALLLIAGLLAWPIRLLHHRLHR